MSAYPDDFSSWSEDRRNAYFAREAEAYGQRKRSENGNGACAPNGNGTHYAPPPKSEDEYGAIDDSPVPIEDRGEPQSGEPDEFATVGGITKRVTTLASLNARYALLQAGGSASAYVSRQDFLPIQDVDLKRRLAGEVVRVVEANGKTAYPTAFKYWTENAGRHVYRRVVFAAGEQKPDALSRRDRRNCARLASRRQREGYRARARNADCDVSRSIGQALRSVRRRGHWHAGREQGPRRDSLGAHQGRNMGRGAIHGLRWPPRSVLSLWRSSGRREGWEQLLCGQ
jgi:hypothetical protein